MFFRKVLCKVREKFTNNIHFRLFKKLRSTHRKLLNSIEKESWCTSEKDRGCITSSSWKNCNLYSKERRLGNSRCTAKAVIHAIRNIYQQDEIKAVHLAA